MALMELIARAALVRSGVCDESDSLVRCARDSATGSVIVMVYLAQFDHAAWSMSRHIEHYLMRQFKGLYGIDVHSVHLNVTRAKAFKQTPKIKSAVSLRAVLRERRRSGVDTSAVTGTHINSAGAPLAPGDAFAPTARVPLEGLADSIGRAGSSRSTGKSASAENRVAPRALIQHALLADEYLSVPGYEVAEVEYEEFLNSLPAAKAAQAAPVPSTPAKHKPDAQPASSGFSEPHTNYGLPPDMAEK